MDAACKSSASCWFTLAADEPYACMRQKTGATLAKIPADTAAAGEAMAKVGLNDAVEKSRLAEDKTAWRQGHPYYYQPTAVAG